MSTLFYVTVFHALGVYSTPLSHRVEEGPHPIEVLQVISIHMNFYQNGFINECVMKKKKV